jgi:hypothetical protein
VPIAATAEPFWTQTQLDRSGGLIADGQEMELMSFTRRLQVEVESVLDIGFQFIDRKLDRRPSVRWSPSSDRKLMTKQEFAKWQTSSKPEDISPSLRNKFALLRAIASILRPWSDFAF